MSSLATHLEIHKVALRKHPLLLYTFYLFNVKTQFLFVLKRKTGSASH